MHHLPLGGQVEAQRRSIVLRHLRHQRGDGGFGPIDIAGHADVMSVEVFVDLFLRHRPLHQGAGATAGLSADNQQHQPLGLAGGDQPLSVAGVPDEWRDEMRMSAARVHCIFLSPFYSSARGPLAAALADPGTIREPRAAPVPLGCSPN